MEQFEQQFEDLDVRTSVSDIYKKKFLLNNFTMYKQFSEYFLSHNSLKKNLDFERKA